ncbi:MAG: cyclic nucleotide-binding domain-containing protein [Gammaproteobacteria bacterium]|nr:cyclic nucleotide-binding domain-containing protein [Gammaproteobacteria bacterium]MDH3768407.1 cyclic nucleotide-binding domain-containing protein [Gammaproteobacteria bacterium]
MPDSFSVSWVDAIGFLGAAATVWAMGSRTIIPLRIGVIVGNVGFLAFGVLAMSYPTIVAHAILLPLNVWRTIQLVRLIEEIKRGSSKDNALEPLISFMRLEGEKAGTTLFRKGDRPDRMILIKSGTVLLKEIDVRLGKEDVLGEIAIFTPENTRTATAVCETDCEIYTLSQEVMLQIYYQNPRFGLFLIRVIVRRLMENWADADARAKAGMA